MFGKLKSFLGSATEELKKQASQFVDADFAAATMALAASVAMADGELEAEEKTKVAGHIRRNTILANFDPSDLQSRFLRFVDDIQFDADTGFEAANAALAKIASDPVKARAAFLIGLSIAKADGDFEDTEKQVLKKAASILRVSTSEFGF